MIEGYKVRVRCASLLLFEINILESLVKYGELSVSWLMKETSLKMIKVYATRERILKHQRHWKFDHKTLKKIFKKESLNPKLGTW